MDTDTREMVATLARNQSFTTPTVILSPGAALLTPPPPHQSTCTNNNANKDLQNLELLSNTALIAFSSIRVLRGHFEKYVYRGKNYL